MRLKETAMPIDFANAQSTNAKTIPVIDVSGAISGDGINGVADEIYAAAINHGFFYIFLPSARRAHKHPQNVIYPPIVGRIYPI